MFQRILPVQQVPPVWRAGRETDSEFSNSMERYDAYSGLKCKRGQRGAEQALETFTYSNTGLENLDVENTLRFDAKA